LRRFLAARERRSAHASDVVLGDAEAKTGGKRAGNVRAVAIRLRVDSDEPTTASVRPAPGEVAESSGNA
jgi:hypothetical protein